MLPEGYLNCNVDFASPIRRLELANYGINIARAIQHNSDQRTKTKAIDRYLS